MANINKLAVVGCGAMGGNHARTIARNLGGQAELTYLVDGNLKRAESLARDIGATGLRVLPDTSGLHAGVVDGVVIATPSEYHASVALELMDKGVNVLIEKPVALNHDDAVAVNDSAERNGLTAMVGHVELFNPVVAELIELLDGSDIRTMRFKRLGKVNDPARIAHDVVQDLMLHDLSIAQLVSDRRSEDDATVVSSHGRSDTVFGPDPAEAILDMGNGIDAHFRASRAYAGGKVRSVEVETNDRLYEANLLSRTIVTKSGEEGAILVDGTYLEEVRTASYFAQETRQPLTLELLHFMESIRGETTPASASVSVKDALRIMRLTTSILDVMVRR